MPEVEELKKTIEEKKVKERKQEELAETIDMEKIDKIVERMRAKYLEEGVEFEAVKGKLGELRGIIAEGAPGQLEIQTIEELKESQVATTKLFGTIFLSFRKFLEPLQTTLYKLKKLEKLSYYLYSANMRYTAKQYTAMALAAAFLALIISIIFSALILTAGGAALTSAIPGILASFVLAIVVFVFAMSIPKRKAMARGNQISVELPFALRHMATELKAGIGLYRTIQAIALAGYGPLSEEFARAVTEIEEGIDSRDALKHLAARTQSKALVNALAHLVRAMETGGNLSTAMNEIAEDVSFEMRLKVRDFSQKMNFFGIIFIFTAIVFPVIITILGMIRNSPVSAAAPAFSQIPLSVEVITIIYVLIIPGLLIGLVAIIKAMQPRV